MPSHVPTSGQRTIANITNIAATPEMAISGFRCITKPNARPKNTHVTKTTRISLSSGADFVSIIVNLQTRYTLVRALAVEDRAESSKKNPEIKPQRLVPQVRDVEAQAVVKIQFASPGDLPQPSYARGGFQPRRVPQIVRCCAKRRRARADHGHVAANYVQYLRQLVQTCPSQPAPYGRNSGIVRDLEIRVSERIQVQQLSFQRLCIPDHRAKLEHSEGSSAPPSSPLEKIHRSPRLHYDCQCA